MIASRGWRHWYDMRGGKKLQLDELGRRYSGAPFSSRTKWGCPWVQCFQAVLLLDTAPRHINYLGRAHVRCTCLGCLSLCRVFIALLVLSPTSIGPSGVEVWKATWSCTQPIGASVQPGTKQNLDGEKSNLRLHDDAGSATLSDRRCATLPRPNQTAARHTLSPGPSLSKERRTPGTCRAYL